MKLHVHPEKKSPTLPAAIPSLARPKRILPSRVSKISDLLAASKGEKGRERERERERQRRESAIRGQSKSIHI